MNTRSMEVTWFSTQCGKTQLLQIRDRLHYKNGEIEIASDQKVILKWLEDFRVVESCQKTYENMVQHTFNSGIMIPWLI